MATAITNGSGARSTPGVIFVVYSPIEVISSLINGYRNNLCPQSKIQNTLMRGIKDLYLKITAQQTKQNIS